MSLPKKHIAFSILAIIFLIAIPIFIINHLSVPQENKLFAGVRQRKADTNFTRQSMRVKDKLILLKNSSVVFNKCEMVFRGIKDKKIHFDLYILELDPKSAYPHHISKEDADKAFRISDMNFELISVNRNVLKLKILDTNK